MKNFFTVLPEWIHNNNVERLLIILVAVLIILMIVYYTKKAISTHVNDTDNKYKARKAATIFGYIVMISIALIVYSDKLGNIGIAFGLAGAGIAFSLQEVITSFIGWISIMITSQIRIGQRVRIGDVTGDIIDIGVLKTTFMEVGDWVDGDLYNGRITTLSNNFVFKTPIQNYSADYPFLWDEITVPIRLESNHKKAREVFLNVTNGVCGQFAKDSMTTWLKMKDKFRIENAQVDPMITLRFDENWITFTIRYVVDYRNRRNTKDKIFTKLLDEIEKNKEDIFIATAAMEVMNLTPED